MTFVYRTTDRHETFNTDVTNGIQCCVSAECKVRSRNIIANGCRDHRHRDAELRVLFSCFCHHHDTLESLYAHRPTRMKVKLNCNRTGLSYLVKNNTITNAHHTIKLLIKEKLQISALLCNVTTTTNYDFCLTRLTPDYPQHFSQAGCLSYPGQFKVKAGEPCK